MLGKALLHFLGSGSLSVTEFHVPQQRHLFVQVVHILPNGSDKYLTLKRTVEGGHGFRTEIGGPKKNTDRHPKQDDDPAKRIDDPVTNGHNCYRNAYPGSPGRR